MAHSFSADSARRKAFDDGAVGDEIEYLTRKIIAASEDGKRRVEIKGNTRMTGANVRSDIEAAPASVEVTGITIASGSGTRAVTVSATIPESLSLSSGSVVALVGVTDPRVSDLSGKAYGVTSTSGGSFAIQHDRGTATDPIPPQISVTGNTGSFIVISDVAIVGRDDKEAKAYYKVWKGDLLPDDQNPDYEETALRRQMDAVIRHFRDRGYSILRKDNGASRVTGVGSTGADTFYWEITW